MSDDKIVLFPTDRIANKDKVNKPIDDAQHQKLVEAQTKEFVEGNVDDIAYTLLDKFVAMGIRTQDFTFTADLALVIDCIRGLVYRDFKKPHPAQQLADKMVTINTKGASKTARLNYNEVLGTNHKQHKPISKTIQDELKDLSDMGNIEFEPDFEPDNDNK